MKKRRVKKYHGFKRGDRIGAAIHRIIASALLAGFDDPRLTEISITTVEMTPDNRMAKVFFSLFADEKEIALTRKSLVATSPVLKRKIADELRLQYTPELRFLHDASQQHVLRMESLFDQIRKDEENINTDTIDDE
jgi:ribosome-binding factor A